MLFHDNIDFIKVMEPNSIDSNPIDIILVNIALHRS